MGKFKKFTDLSVKQIKAKGTKHLVTEGDALYLEISPRGLKTWKHMYQVAGQNRWYKLGTFPALGVSAARAENKTIKKNTDRGRPPVNPKGLNRTSTVIELYTEWYDKGVGPKGRPWSESYKRNVRELFKNEVIACIGGYKLNDVYRTDIQAITDRVINRGAPSRARQLYRILSRLFNYAAQRGYIETSPMVSMVTVGHQNKKDRYLDTSEIEIFIQALSASDMAADTANALELVLRTGQRPAEICGASKVEMEGDWWVIPPERTKNRKEHRVPLTPKIKELFGYANDAGYFFPSTKNPGKPISSTVLSKALRRSLSGKEKDGNDAVTIPVAKPFTPHDLRRTCATHLAGLGFNTEALAAVLNHTRADVTSAVYNQHSYDGEKRRALLAWERKLAEIVTGDSPGKVVNFPQ